MFKKCKMIALFTVVTSLAVASDSIVIEVIEDHGTRIGEDFIFPSGQMWGLVCKSSTSSPVEWIRPTLPKVIESFLFLIAKAGRGLH